MSYVPSYEYNSLYKTNKFKVNNNWGSNSNIKTNEINKNIFHSDTYGNLNQIKQQNIIATNRHNGLLTNLQSNIVDCYLKNSKTNKYLPLIEFEKYNMGTYLNENHPSTFQTDINYKLLSKQNELLAVKTVLENQIEQNQYLLKMENEYCDKMNKMNEDLLKKIQQLSDENDKLTYERKKLQKNYAVMEEQINFSLMSIMTKPKVEPKADIEFIPPKNVEEPIKEEEIEESEEDEEVKERMKRYKLIKEKIVTLNMNHKPGKLDEIRKKQLEEQLQKEKQEIEERLKLKKIKEKYERPIILNSSMIIETNEKDVNKNLDKNNIHEKEKEKKFDYIIDNNKASVKHYSASLKKMQTISPNQQPSKNINPKVKKSKEINLIDLSSKKVPNEEKEKVLKIIIDKIESYAKECKTGTLLYKDYHKNTNELRQELRVLYENLKNDPNTDVNIDLLPMLIFEIVNSNYNLNLNPEKLKEKGEYDTGDFEIDLNEDYEKIVNDTLNHLKKMVKGGYGNKKEICIFLACALCNFEHDDMMIERLANVIQDLLNEK